MSAMDKADRLFEVLTIDNDDGTGLYYIDIS